MKTKFIFKWIVTALIMGATAFLLHNVFGLSYSAMIAGFIGAFTSDCIMIFRKSKNAKN